MTVLVVSVGLAGCNTQKPMIKKSTLMHKIYTETFIAATKVFNFWLTFKVVNFKCSKVYYNMTKYDQTGRCMIRISFTTCVSPCITLQVLKLKAQQ